MTVTEDPQQNKFLKLVVQEIEKFLFPLSYIIEPLTNTELSWSNEKKSLEVKSRLSHLFLRLGYDVYDQSFDLSLLSLSMEQGLTDFFRGNLSGKKDQLDQMLSREDSKLTTFIEIFQKVLEYGSSIYTLKTVFDSVGDDRFFDRLFNLLVFSYAYDNYTTLSSILIGLKIFVMSDEDLDSENFLPCPQVDYKNFIDLLLDPLQYLKERFKLEDLSTNEKAQAAAEEISKVLEIIVASLSGFSRKGLEGFGEKWLPDDAQTQIMRQSFDFFIPFRFTLPKSMGERSGEEIYSSFGATLSLLSENQEGPGVVLSPRGNLVVPNCSFDSFSIEDIYFQGESGTVLFDKKGAHFFGDTASIGLGATLIKDGGADPENGQKRLPCVLIGNREGTHFSIQKVSLKVGAEFSAQKSDASFLFGFDTISMVLKSSDLDSFLSSILPAEPLEIKADLALGYSTKKGFGIQGGAGFKYTNNVNSRLGPILLQSYTIELKASPEGIFFFGALSGSAELGPLAISIGEIGFGFNSLFQKPEDKSRFAIAIKPPSAIGIAIDAGMISGGGYLQIDPPNYNGILSASFAELFDITIIALVSTRLPGNVNGFSMLLSILAQFVPVQLGFGFALSGVGGLIGIHRKIVETELRAVVKSHELDSILFPESPIKDANKIIQSLSKIFPPYQDRFAFGLMGEVIWGGVVKIITIQIGLLFEFGGAFKLGLLGQLGMALPAAEAPLVEIHADIFGFFDSGAKTICIDSSIYDSRILIFELCGDIALRIFYGERADFLFSAGGFFPGYTPTIAIGKMDRLTISLKTNIVTISCENYIAVTSNTVQIGSAFSLQAQLGPFEVLGGAGFDALIQFSPFMFEVRFYAYLDIKVFGFSLIGVDLRMQLIGPNPFYFNGTITLKLCFFIKVTLRAEFTIGEKEPEEISYASPLNLLVEEVKEPLNWKTEVPSWTLCRVELKDQPEIKNLFDPGGAFVFRQKVIPLDMTLERFAKAKTDPSENHLFVRITNQNSNFMEITTYEDFAPAEFTEMSPSEKLSAPAFEKYPAGKKFDQFMNISASNMSSVQVQYDRIIVNERANDEFDLVRLKKNVSFLETSLQHHFAKLRGQSYFSNTEKSVKTISGKVNVRDNQFTIASEVTIGGKLVRESKGGRALHNMTFFDSLKAKKEHSRAIVSVAGVTQ